MKTSSEIFYFLIFFLIIGLTSCSTSPTKSPFRGNSKKEKYVNLRKESKRASYYILPRIPKWANYSQTGACRLSKDIYYLNLFKMRKYLNTDYFNTLQIQYLMNLKIAEKRKEKFSGNINLGNEEMIFYEAKEQISNGGIRPFMPPDFESINIVWIDPYLDLDNLKKFTQLKRFMKSNIADKSPMVFISLCKSFREIKSFIKEGEFLDFDIHIISNEMFNIYNSKNEQGTHLLIDLDQFFKKDQKISLYLLDLKLRPKEIQGTFQLKKMP